MLAIHTRAGSFAQGWVKHCQERGIAFKEVDCFSSDIIERLEGCRALLWQWQDQDYPAPLFARQIISSVETMGVPVFPNSATSWHYDDKVGRKYLLEAVGAPLLPSHVFYNPHDALDWLETAHYPLVWKLRGGAGSQNVKLVRSAAEGRRIVHRSFGRGWRASRLHSARERLWKFRRKPGWASFLNIGRGLARAIVPHETYRKQAVDKDCVYFQDFAPQNDHDIRVIVIGNRAFAIKRMVRDGDFRASGSGVIIHAKEEIPEACVEIAFDVTNAIGSQCCAFDFVRSQAGWSLVEISYAFSLAGYRECPGYWRADMSWQPAPFRPESFMVEGVLAQLNESDNQNG